MAIVRPLDYYVWDVVEAKTNAKSRITKDSLKVTISNIDKEEFKYACMIVDSGSRIMVSWSSKLTAEQKMCRNALNANLGLKKEENAH